MLASHCLPTWAVFLPHLRSPCSSITRTPFSLGAALALASSMSSSRRSLTFPGSHLDSERNHCRLCASLRCAPTTGSVLARAVRVLDLTPVGGQTRVSDMNADEGSPHNAGSDTKLPAGIQTRGRPPCPLLAGQERRPDSQGAWRLGQLSA